MTQVMVFPSLPLGNYTFLWQSSVTDHLLLCSQHLLWLSFIPLLLVIPSRTTLTCLISSEKFWELKFILPRQAKGSKQKIIFFRGYCFLWRSLRRIKPCPRKELVNRRNEMTMKWNDNFVTFQLNWHDEIVTFLLATFNLRVIILVLLCNRFHFSLLENDYGWTKFSAGPNGYNCIDFSYIF